jgi:hypothetical protein
LIKPFKEKLMARRFLWRKNRALSSARQAGVSVKGNRAERAAEGAELVEL